MKVNFMRDVRRPIEIRQEPFIQSMSIDDQFKDIINRQCPGKLHKLLKQKAKRRMSTQPVLDVGQNNRQSKVFEKTFYQERLKTTEKERRTHSMRLQLQERLKMIERPPSPFFKLSRANILGLQRSSLSGQKIRSLSQERTPKKIKILPHPYIRISQKTTLSVWRQLGNRTRMSRSQFVDFRPFGKIEPVQLV